MQRTCSLTILALILGCSGDNHANELALAKGQLADVQGQLALAKGANADLRAKIEELQKTPDGLWRIAVQGGTQSNGYKLDENSLQEFIKDYPSDPRIATAKRLLQQAAAKREEAQNVAKLGSVTIAEINADPGAYRGKRFEREICCDDVRTWEGQQEATCYWNPSVDANGNTDRDLDNRIKLLMSTTLAKEIVANRAVKATSISCKYRFTAIQQFMGIDLVMPKMRLLEIK